MPKRLQIYDSPAVTVTFDPNVCIHSGVCVHGLPAVFDIKRQRWIRPELASAAEVAAQVARCPSGALQYRLKEREGVELRCKAFLFDLDGVLVDSRAVVERTWRRWAERHQVDPDTLLRIAHGRRTMDTLQIAVPHLAVDEEVEWLDSTELRDVDGLTVVPGADQLLSVLPPGRWAIVTSCTRALATLRLESVGLPVPSVLVVGEEVKHGKPAPDGYQIGAARLGYTPADCLVVEDAPAGVMAGRSAGARVLALTTTHPAGDLIGAEAVVRDLRTIDVRAEHDAFIVSPR